MDEKTIAIKKLMLDAQINQPFIAQLLGVSQQQVSHTITFIRTSGPNIERIRFGLHKYLKRKLGEKCPAYNEVWGIQETVNH